MMRRIIIETEIIPDHVFGGTQIKRSLVEITGKWSEKAKESIYEDWGIEIDELPRKTGTPVRKPEND